MRPLVLDRKGDGRWSTSLCFDDQWKLYFNLDVSHYPEYTKSIVTSFSTDDWLPMMSITRSTSSRPMSSSRLLHFCSSPSDERIIRKMGLMIASELGLLNVPEGIWGYVVRRTAFHARYDFIQDLRKWIAVQVRVVILGRERYGFTPQGVSFLPRFICPVQCVFDTVCFLRGTEND